MNLIRHCAVMGALGLLIVNLPLTAQVNLPSTTNNIHLGLMGDSKVPNLSVLAGKVDYIFAAATSAGVPPSGIYVDGYLPYDRDDSNESFSWFQSNHPSWVVYTCSNNVAYEFGNPNVPFDITNSAVQSYQIQEVSKQFASVPEGFAFNGIGWDNIVTLNWIPRCKTLNGLTWDSLYTGAYIDQSYVNSIISWAANMYSAVHSEFPGKGVSMNLSTGSTGYSSPKFEEISGLFPYVDLVFDERGFTAYGNGPITGADWENEITNLELLNTENKAFFVSNEWNNVPNDQSITHAQINWSLANYLLVKGSHSYVYIYPLDNGVQGYGNFYDRPEYHVAIGSATSARYTYDGVQRRDYSGGMTLVNPSSTLSYTVTLPSTYSDLWGNHLSSITMAPATAEVLLSAPSAFSIAGVSPNSGSGSSATFSATVSYPTGSSVYGVHILINSTLTGTDACWVQYYQSTGKMQLSYDNTPSSLTWQPAVALGTNTTEQNSECSVNFAGAKISGSGDTFTLEVPITFNSSWIGTKTIYVQSRDGSATGTTVGYTAEGSWVVP